MTAVREIHGRHLQQDITQGNLVSDALSTTLPITNAAISATITVGAEGTPAANQRAVTITLLNANGVAINYIQTFEVIVYADATRAALCTTGGSSAMAAVTGIIVSQPLAKKHYFCQTNASGLCVLTWIDTATETVALGVILPNGMLGAISAAFANA